MTSINHIFSLNTFILLFAFLFLYLSAAQLREAFYNKGNLQMHKGALVEKEITVDKDDDQENKYLLLTLNNQEKYTVSRSVEYIFNKITLIDFKQHQENLKSMLWGFPPASAGLFGCFFYRRHIGIRNETTKKI